MKRQTSTVLIGLVGASLSIGIFVACGSTKATDDSQTDAGNTSDANGAKDVVVADNFVEPVMDSATCDLSKDLTSSIPDAALDDAGHTTGVCLGCVNQPSTCQMQVQACSSDCDCQTAIGQVITCIANGGSQQSCGLTLLGLPQGAQGEGIALLTCVQQNCSDQCIPAGFGEGGTDGGTDANDQ